MDTSKIKGPEFWSDRKKKLAEFGNIIFDMSASTNPERHKNFLTYYAYRARDYIASWGKRLTSHDRFSSLYTQTKSVPLDKDGENQPQ